MQLKTWRNRSLLTRRLLSFENYQSHCWSIPLFSIRNHFLLLGINCATNGRPGSWARHFPSLCNPKLTATLSVQRRWMPASGRRLYIVTIYLNGASNSGGTIHELLLSTIQELFFYTMRCLLFVSNVFENIQTKFGKFRHTSSVYLIANVRTRLNPGIKAHR